MASGFLGLAASVVAVTPANVDASAAVALAVFAAWGARRDAARQLAGVLVLLAAFAAASLLSSRIAPNISKVATLSPEDNAGVAYLTAFCGTLLLGAVLLHWVSAGLERAPRGG